MENTDQPKGCRARIEEKFSFICDKMWRDLEKTSDDDVRFCNHCDQTVHLATSEDQIDALAKQKKCVCYIFDKDNELAGDVPY